MKNKTCGVISEEELKWLSKNIKKKQLYNCNSCPFGILKKRKDMTCIYMLEKAFGIKPDTGCIEINRIMYNFFKADKQNKI